MKRCIVPIIMILSAGIVFILSSCSDSSGPDIQNTETVTVTHGIEINASNTGVPQGYVLHDITSTITVTEAWISGSNDNRRYIENMNFVNGARLIVKCGDFTVRYCKFNGKSGGSVEYGLKNVVFEYCEFDGQHLNTGGDCALGIGGLTARRLHIHGWPRAFWSGWGDILIEECYIHDVTADGGDAHLENIYIAGGANQKFIRNKLITNEVHINGGSRMMVSASLAIYNEDYSVGDPLPAFPDLDNIVVSDNYFESDGYYAMYCGACAGKTGAHARNMSVTGNIFGRQLHRNCGVAGPAVAFDPAQPGNVWENNTWGAPGSDWVSGDPAEGAAVGAPQVQ